MNQDDSMISIPSPASRALKAQSMDEFPSVFIQTHWQKVYSEVSSYSIHSIWKKSSFLTSLKSREAFRVFRDADGTDENFGSFVDNSYPARSS